MKKLGFILAVLATTAVTASEVKVMFSTPGPDKYADGTSVLKGETYALVWKESADAAFSIAADGTVTGGKVVLTYQTKEAGHCSDVLFVVPEAWLTEKGIKDGVWAVELLDTRVYAADGTVSFAAVDATTLMPKAVNATAEASTAVVASTAESVPAATGKAAGVTAVASAVPENVPQPNIKAIEIKGDFVHVTVENTVPYLNYDLAAGDSPDALKPESGKTQTGVAGKDITFVTPVIKDGAFFTISRH